MKLTRLLATRLLSGHDRKHFFAAGWVYAFIGVFLASLFVLVALGILSGYQRAYREAILRFNTHVIVSRDAGLDVADRKLIVATLKKLSLQIPHVASPYLYRETLVPVAGGFKPVILKGVDFKSLSKIYPFRVTSFETEQTGDVILGKNLAEELGATQKNPRFKYLKFEPGSGKSRQHATRFDTLPVGGVFESGLYHYDGQYVLIDLVDLKKRLATDHVHGFEIRLDKPEEMDALVRHLKSEFASRYEVTTWQELNADLFRALQLERVTIFTIILLILTVASLNIFGFNFLFFMGRIREFRILWLMGLSRTMILKLMRRLSVALGFVATLLAAIVACGVLMYLRDGGGVELDPSVYYVDRIPVHFEWLWFGVFLAVSWALCDITSFLAGRVVIKRHLGQRV